MEGRRSLLLFAVVLAVVLTVSSLPARAAHPLSRSLPDYAILAMRSVALKDLVVLNGCNVGVDCASGGVNKCGVAGFEELMTPGDGSQIAAETVNLRAGADLFQLFRDGGGLLTGVTIRHPPVLPLVSPNQLPILPGTCGPSCNPNVPAVSAVCGFPSPFPTCGGPNVDVNENGDCMGVADATLGNGRCDLGPGTYGAVNVKKFARILMAPGTYTVCSFEVGRGGVVTAGGPVVLNIDGGELRVSNEAMFGGRCGDFTIRVAGGGDVGLGKNVFMAANVCAPASEISLGRDNQLVGQFVGDTIVSDRRNVIECCPVEEPCVCFDSFMPDMAKVGDLVTLKSGCDLTHTTAVRICGIDANIESVTPTQLVVRVPAGANGACVIEADSVPGVYTANDTLNVVP